MARVVKVTKTRARLEYETPSTGKPHGCWAHSTDNLDAGRELAPRDVERFAMYGPLALVTHVDAAHWPIVFRVIAGAGRLGDELVRVQAKAAA